MESPLIEELKGSALWLDWRWQMANRIAEDGQADFPTLVTPYYASLIETQDPSDPIYRMVVRQARESDDETASPDPLREETSSPVPGLIRRYADRAVVLAASSCAAHCRYCDRKRYTSHGGVLTDMDLKRIVKYLNANREIRDVIVSGGDPLTLPDERLEAILSALHGAGSVEILRIGTRVPVTMPMRVTEELCSILKRYHPLYINTHFNHPRELTREAGAACGMLADAGVQLGNQSVLLRGVNDDAGTLEDLFRGLLRIRVRPYYLFQCEPVPGTAHLRVPLRRGLDIMDALRRRVGGMALPSYVLDTEDRGGKIPLTSETVRIANGEVLLKMNDGRIVSYPAGQHGAK